MVTNPNAVAYDHEDIEKGWKKALQLEPPEYVKAPQFHPEYFPVFDSCGKRLREKGLIINWRAHLTGLRHKTANVLLITNDGRLLAQQRAHDTILFPSRYTVSAGGHVSKTSLEDDSEIDPLQTAVEETEGELGLKIDKARFEPLGDSENGIANFLNVWMYNDRDQGVEATIAVFDQAASRIGIDVRRGVLRDDNHAKLKELIRSEAKGDLTENKLLKKGISLFTRNIELCHFYTVVISQEEQRGNSLRRRRGRRLQARSSR